MLPQKNTVPGHWFWRTSGVLLAVTLFIAVSVWAYMPWWELAFRSDTSPVSWLSSALLFACSVLALQIRVQGRLPPMISLWLVVSMLAMALDEQFMFHEFWKYHCSEWTEWCGRPTTGHIDWLGDAPMLLVGVLGLGTVVVLYQRITASVVRGLLMAAIGVGIVGALGLHFAHAGNLLPAWYGRFEEVLEVCAEALFLCALLEIPFPSATPGVAQVQSASSL